MLDDLSEADFLHMTAMADRAIASCLGHAAAGRRKLGEVSAVKAVVTQGMYSVAQRWRRSRRLPLSELRLQTVFCHSAPQVSFTRPGPSHPGRCELADLLLVVDHLSARSLDARRRAVLVQAKLQAPPGHLRLNNSNERVQFELLSGWPSFTFIAGLYLPHARDFTHGPPLSAWGGEYGGIDQPPPGSWTQYLITSPNFSANPPVHGAVSLGKLVAGMLAGRAGYGRPAVPHGRDPWSETVQELLDVTFGLAIKRSQPKSRRGYAHALSFNSDLGADAIRPPQGAAAGGPPSLSTDDGEDWPDGAISVARFIVDEFTPSA